MNAVAIILAGGIGKRLNPLSTQEKPKQFHRLLGNHTLLQATYERISPFISSERIFVFTQSQFVHWIAEQLPKIDRNHIICEPAMRDTAGALVYATLLCEARFGNPIMMVFPSDHWIDSLEKFSKAMQSAANAAKDNLYTIGIRPDHPATGYGYLCRGEEILHDGGCKHYRLLHFEEKPSLERAKQFLAQGNYFWNGGILVGQVATFLKEFTLHLPDHLAVLKPFFSSQEIKEESFKQAFLSLPSLSFDYGVLEKSKHLSMVVADFAWSDLGTWESLEKVLGKPREIILEELGYGQNG